MNNIDKEAVTRISNIVTSLKKFVRLDEAELQEADINKAALEFVGAKLEIK